MLYDAAEINTNQPVITPADEIRLSPTCQPEPQRIMSHFSEPSSSVEPRVRRLATAFTAAEYFRVFHTSMTPATEYRCQRGSARGPTSFCMQEAIWTAAAVYYSPLPMITAVSSSRSDFNIRTVAFYRRRAPSTRSELGICHAQQ